MKRSESIAKTFDALEAYPYEEDVHYPVFKEWWLAQVPGKVPEPEILNHRMGVVIYRSGKPVAMCFPYYAPGSRQGFIGYFCVNPEAGPKTKMMGLQMAIAKCIYILEEAGVKRINCYVDSPAIARMLETYDFRQVTHHFSMFKELD